MIEKTIQFVRECSPLPSTLVVIKAELGAADNNAEHSATRRVRAAGRAVVYFEYILYITYNWLLVS